MGRPAPRFAQDWEQFEELTPYLESGEVAYVEDSGLAFLGIQSKFPILSFRVHWVKVPNACIRVERSSDEFAELVCLFLRTVVSGLGASEDGSLWVAFEGYTNGAVKMNPKTLEETAFTFFSIAQHTYVVPPTFDWCIHYTFEGYLHFGFADAAKGELLDSIRRDLTQVGLQLLENHS